MKKIIRFFSENPLTIRLPYTLSYHCKVDRSKLKLIKSQQSDIRKRGIIMKDLAKSIKTFFTDCAELIDIVVYKGNL